MAPPVQEQEWFAHGLRFTCGQCGNCCSGPPGYVWFTPEEARAIAGHLKISEQEFLDRFTHAVGDRLSLTEVRTRHGYDCVFLRRDAQGRALCSVYPVRPRQCRTWPFWPENLATRSDFERLARRCAGVEAGLRGEGRLFPVQQVRIIRDSNAQR